MDAQFSFPPLQAKFVASRDSVNSNLLVLLHGLGDSRDNFAKFGIGMNLPQTGLLLLQAPFPIPYFDEGSCWYPSFDLAGNELTMANQDTRLGLEKTRRLLGDLLNGHVLWNAARKTGWPAERVFLLGFAQGGQVALDLAQSLPLLGGVVSLSGYLDPLSYSAPLSPVHAKGLLLYGQLETGVDSLREMTRRALPQVQQVAVGGRGLAMPSSRAEMEQIVQFFAKHLWLRNLALEAMADEVSFVERVE
ncbi:hypothetical protein HDU91_003791 [Kappamyces sp. JEL0680]|nr:hypothetical protein HDU91_003791 [Kappamyces sp. JEL0680]